MRKFFTTALVLAAVMSLATTGLALEKTAARIDDSRADFWSQDYTCSVAYYNFCTGWIWCWSGWSPNDMFGTCFTTCCNPALGETTTLTASWAYACTGSPTGYGFTGAMEVWGTDGACCPTAPLFSQPLLVASGWNGLGWGVSVPDQFIMMYVCSPATGDPFAMATDHPAAGPTGPQACGYCYPSPRTTFSFYYGTPTTILCPGSPLDDGICYAELVFDVALDCIEGVSVEDSSWGTIKGLYR
jgi:hypothetical protein